MAARNQVQFRGAAPRSEAAVSKKRPDVARKRFKNVLKECETLLKCLGVRCIKGHGEAEATCATLNAQNLVDAVVSQDSDCFAYGARRVYRNFSVSNAAGGGALQGSVDCYDADKMYQNNGFGRKKMVALALLCGCDYGVGACGSSINTAVSFLHTIPENDVIPRLLSWVTDVDRYEEQSRWVGAPGRCDRCGHFGRTHGKSGCPVCVTHRGCNDTGHKTKISEVKRELSLRNRALTCGSPFPEPKVMKEFLNTPPEEVDLNRLKNPIPSLIQFVKLMTHKLDWSERYCVEKFLPLLTKWHLQDNVPSRTIRATNIKKKRNPRGVPSYEVVWGDIDRLYAELIPDDQFDEDEDPLVAWTTVERQDLMRKYYPDIVEAYEESIKKPPKEKKTRARKKKEPDNPDKPKRKYNRKPKNVAEVLQESMKAAEPNSSVLNVSVPVNKLKRKIKNNTKKGQKTITSFIASKKRRTSKKLMQSLGQSFKNLSLHCDEDMNPVVKNDYLDDLFDAKENINVNNVPSSNVPNFELDGNHYLSMLSKTDDDGLDLSDIIDKIVKRPTETKTAKVQNNLVKLVFDKYSTPKKISNRKSILNEVHNNCSTPNDSPIAKRKFRFSMNSPVQKSNFNSTPNNSLVGKSKFRFSTNSPIHKNDFEVFKNSSIRKSSFNVGSCNNSVIGKANTSYFFDKLTEDGDAFEMSLEHKSAVVIHLDSTVDYSLPDVRL
ncbi:XPG-like endonuclease isoform X2 [Anticarsia gemmatalis]